jgi:hypothetical protein
MLKDDAIYIQSHTPKIGPRMNEEACLIIFDTIEGRSYHERNTGDGL